MNVLTLDSNNFVTVSGTDKNSCIYVCSKTAIITAKLGNIARIIVRLQSHTSYSDKAATTRHESHYMQTCTAPPYQYGPTTMHLLHMANDTIEPFVR